MPGLDDSIDSFLFRIVRFMHYLWISTRKMLRQICRTPSETYYETRWFMYNDDRSMLHVDKPVFSDQAKIAIERVVRFKPDGRSDERHAIWYRDKSRQQYEYSDLFQPCSPPWFLISADDTDVTSIYAPYVCPGNFISLEFLNTSLEAKKWIIMDTKTFEDSEFPSEGIIIKNAE